MQKLTVSRDDGLYEAFTDIAKAPDGTLVCTYRESMGHGPWPFSRIIIRRSEDSGRTWSDRQVIIEKNGEAGEGSLNCSRITACQDGTLLLIVDFKPPRAANKKSTGLQTEGVRNLLFRSHDCGKRWEGPEDTGMNEGIVPSIKELSNGDLLVGLTRHRWREDGGLIEEQMVYRSSDGGHTWEGPTLISEAPRLRLNEGDFAELDDGTVVLYMREDEERLSGWKSISKDGGRTWEKPFRSEIRSCLGRPSVGRTHSGEIVVTYRFLCGSSTSLGFYVENPKTQEVRFAFLDNDRSVRPDSGYSGWMQLENGDLYVVNYVNDDAPMAYIRGYIVPRDYWLLAPESNLRERVPTQK